MGMMRVDLGALHKIEKICEVKSIFEYQQFLCLCVRDGWLLVYSSEIPTPGFFSDEDAEERMDMALQRVSKPQDDLPTPFEVAFGVRESPQAFAEWRHDMQVAEAHAANPEEECQAEFKPVVQVRHTFLISLFIRSKK